MAIRRAALAYTPVRVDYVNGVTDKAVLVGVLGREVWIPRSQIFTGDIPEGRAADPRVINVAAWFVKKEGLQ